MDLKQSIKMNKNKKTIFCFINIYNYFKKYSQNIDRQYLFL